MSDTIRTPTGTQRLASIDALRGFDMLMIMGMDRLVHALANFAADAANAGTWLARLVRTLEAWSDQFVDLCKLRQFGIGGFRMTALNDQFEHVSWEGFRFYDMIFPLFLFVIGVVLPYSLGKYETASEGRRNAIWRVLSRFGLMMFLAFLYAGLLSKLGTFKWAGVQWTDPILLLLPLFIVLPLKLLLGEYATRNGESQAAIGPWIGRTFRLLCFGALLVCLTRCDLTGFRWAGVLQRLAIGYFVAAVAVVMLPKIGQGLFGLAVIGGYAALLLYYPVPEFGKGNFTPEGNISTYVDQKLLVERMHSGLCCYKFGDNEGTVSTLGGIATAMLGVMFGHFLRSSSATGLKFLGLIVAGAACLWGGHALSPIIPIIKNLWSPSFVLVAGGWSLLLLALFYGVIDGLGFKRWAFFFIVIGMNAITIYLAPKVIDFDYTARFFFGGVIRIGQLEPYWRLIGVVAVLSMKWLFLYFLYTKKVFLRA